MNEITQAQTFEEKMKDRIRDSIGDLLSDDDLKKLIDRGMEDVFFKGKQIRDGWGSVTREELPLIHQMVKEHIGPMLEKEVALYIDQNRELVAQVVRQSLEVGAGTLMLKAMDRMFNDKLISMQMDIVNSLRNNGVIR